MSVRVRGMLALTVLAAAYSVARAEGLQPLGELSEAREYTQRPADW